MIYVQPESYIPPSDPDAKLLYDRLMDRIIIDGIAFSGKFFRSMRPGTFVVTMHPPKAPDIFGPATVELVTESTNRFKRAWQAFWR